MAYYLGIDGGGTRTTAWVANEQGRIIGKAEAGPSNPLKTGFAAAQRELLHAAREAIEKACAAAATVTTATRLARDHGAKGRGLPRAETSQHTRLKLEAVVLGLAGADRPQVHDRLMRWVKKAIPARHYLLTSDAAIALAAALGNSPGIIVIAGTGSIACARDEGGRFLRSGGWGALFDDAGSGYDIGKKAITAALWALDGRGEATRLGPAICRALKLRKLTEVIWKPPSPSEIAALFPAVARAARRGDSVARFLLDTASRDLAGLVLALVDRLGWKRKEFIVVSSGGIFRSSARLRKCFGRFVRSTSPRARVLLLNRPAVQGALTLARQIGQRQ